MTNIVYQNDIPEKLLLTNGDIAVDTEAMGLSYNTRDRLCVVQFSFGDGNAHLVHFDGSDYSAPNLTKLLGDNKRKKIYHFARFDVGIIKKYLNIWATPIFCTRLSSTMCRTYTDSHSLRELCYEFAGLRINKACQTSYWGQERLTNAQIEYAANDVLHLHKIKSGLEKMLIREKRLEIAYKCFDFIQTRCELDLLGWQGDIFQHQQK